MKTQEEPIAKRTRSATCTDCVKRSRSLEIERRLLPFVRRAVDRGMSFADLRCEMFTKPERVQLDVDQALETLPTVVVGGETSRISGS
jgi:hypothetical protein